MTRQKESHANKHRGEGWGGVGGGVNALHFCEAYELFSVVSPKLAT